MSIDRLLSELGYRQSRFFRPIEQDVESAAAAHLMRDARRANVSGTYYIRTTPNDAARRERPAVYVAEATSVHEARQIHRLLWNQGTTPFLVVSLPGQVRVYTTFAFDLTTERGLIDAVDTDQGYSGVAARLRFLGADAIDSGEIWQTQSPNLMKDGRVDQTLLRNLRALTHQLVARHDLDLEIAHALIGRFVYLYYLRDRDILSDQWLQNVGVAPDSVFSLNVRLNAFRRLTDAVDTRFNGQIFPIDWSSRSAPHADAVREIGRAFAGEDVSSGQLPLFSAFDFSFIPIELLSAIYEQFLRDTGEGGDVGAVYTSPPLAEYLLSEIDAVKPLTKGMKVLDPCCGSGIFLVLAFRRLVEQQLHLRSKRKLLPTELRELLTGSVFGIERNPEACLVTEFSLILTLLSYIDPPELHRLPNFQFPSLRNEQVFQADFFSNDALGNRGGEKFDWVVGNPPWVELAPADLSEQPAIAWILRNKVDAPVARFRTSEAFTWKVREHLAHEGAVGLVTQATTLTNDQSQRYRKAFFTKNTVHRLTNLSNLAYILFESAEEPAATLTYSARSPDEDYPGIIHIGPLVVNQVPTSPGHDRRRKAPWVLTISESEIQIVPAAEAAQGDATTWKRALWGNPRDHRALQRLRRSLPTTLSRLATQRNWALNLGLQLRVNKGSDTDQNQEVLTIRRNEGATENQAVRYAEWFAQLKVVEPRQFAKTPNRLTVPEHWLVKNRWGTSVRKRGGAEGLKILRAPHLLLWNEFAAFSNEDFIFRHPQLGLAAEAKDADWLKAVSTIWTCSITPYFLFLDLSAGWGISRSTIDLGDARRMPMPHLDDSKVRALAALHDELAAAESAITERASWQKRLDDEVALILSIPKHLMIVARDFCEYRLPLIKGKAPANITKAPDASQLQKYAARLKVELDAFLERESRRHSIRVASSRRGIVATIELLSTGKTGTATVCEAGSNEAKAVDEVLHLAELQYGQWLYVKRSVRIFAGKQIHVCKPPRRLEWTETAAMLDAADVIAEVAEIRKTG